MIPEYTKESIDSFVARKLPPGGFVSAVLENNLSQAFARADLENERHMKDIVSYVYNHIPMDAWGSPEKVAAWWKGE